MLTLTKRHHTSGIFVCIHSHLLSAINSKKQSNLRCTFLYKHSASQISPLSKIKHLPNNSRRTWIKTRTKIENLSRYRHNLQKSSLRYLESKVLFVTKMEMVWSLRSNCNVWITFGNIMSLKILLKIDHFLSNVPLIQSYFMH